MGVMSRQCLADRMGDVEQLEGEVIAWAENRNAKDSKVDLRFTTADARIKLKKLYHTI